MRLALLRGVVKKESVAALVFTVLFGCASAGAYVLPGRDVLQQWVRNFGKEKRIWVRQQVTVRPDPNPENAILVNETVRYRIPDAFRSEAKSDAIERVHLNVLGSTLTLLDRTLDAVPQGRFDRYGELILCRNRFQAEGLLARYGIDPDLCSLGRMGDAVVYVIGARYPDLSVSQLWIDKETFWPVRWIFVEGKATRPREAFEIRYLLWAKEGTAWYPRRMEFYTDGVVERIAEVLEVSVDPPFEAALFDLERVRSAAVPADESEGASGKTPPEHDEIRKTIEKFKKIYE